ncbi:FK506-binding protein 5-like [Watersipora subatra]|uniref:FK506-binding protein 5-like n=1 Tax=Watersipora subatra TaxID=2589382 RepID=UPI00355C99B6
MFSTEPASEYFSRSSTEEASDTGVYSYSPSMNDNANNTYITEGYNNTGVGNGNNNIGENNGQNNDGNYNGNNNIGGHNGNNNEGNYNGNNNIGGHNGNNNGGDYNGNNNIGGHNGNNNGGSGNGNGNFGGFIRNGNEEGGSVRLTLDDILGLVENGVFWPAGKEDASSLKSSDVSSTTTPQMTSTDTYELDNPSEIGTTTFDWLSAINITEANRTFLVDSKDHLDPKLKEYLREYLPSSCYKISCNGLHLLLILLAWFMLVHS